MMLHFMLQMPTLKEPTDDYLPKLVRVHLTTREPVFLYPGNSEEYGDSNMFFGMQSQYPLEIGLSISKITTPIMYISNKNNSITIHQTSFL